MKAVYLTKFGTADSAFETREADVPKPESTQVLIKVEAFGLNFADVLARKGLYPDVPSRPCVLGYEVVGLIEEIGSEVPALFKGMRVVALTRFGGYAEYAVTDFRALASIPVDYPADQAVAIGTQFTTAYICFYESLNLHPADRVLVHAAAGGVGIALCQMALAKGCEVFATAGSDAKIDFLNNLGVQHAVNYSERDYSTAFLQTLGKAKLDASFNSLAGKSIPADMKLLGPGGKMVIYGAASRVGKSAGIISSIALLLRSGYISPLTLIMRSKSIIGVNLLKLGDYKPQLVAHCLEQVVKMALPTDENPIGVLKPVVGGRYSVSELAEAHKALENRSTIGKLSVFW